MEKILIIGGSQFIGRNLVEQLLLDNRYSLTLFNRQRTNKELFPEVEKIKGDRESGDLSALSAGSWDYVIDLSSYYPNSLPLLFDQLKGVKKYIYISTVSVYDFEADASSLKMEDSPLLSCSDEEKTDPTPSTYGRRKAACEEMVRNSGLPWMILRPGIVYGRYDHTDRFYYWLYQVWNNNRVLVPENGNRVLSATYVGDLVTAILNSVVTESSDQIFNVITRPELTISEVIETTAAILQKEIETISADAAFLFDQDIKQWSDLPLWINADNFTFGNANMVSGLDFQPTSLHDSILATVKHFNDNRWHQPVAGITEEQRDNLIRLLEAR